MMKTIIFAVALAMAACSSSGGGTDPGPTLPTPLGFFISLVSPTDGGVTSAVVNLSFKTSDTTAIFECDIDGNIFACTPTGTATQILPNGPHTLSVKGTQSDGNTLTEQIAWNVDAIGPTVQIDSPTSATTTSSGTYAFTTSDAVQLLCFFDGGPPSTCASGDTFNGLTPGPHTLEVIGFDSVGNPSSTASVTFTVN